MSYIKILKSIILESNNQDVIVYLDMDGVLADMHKKKVEIVNKTNRQEILNVIKDLNLTDQEQQLFLDDLSSHGKDSSVIDQNNVSKISKSKFSKAEKILWKAINSNDFFEKLDPLYDNNLIKKIFKLKEKYNFKLGILGSAGDQTSFENFKKQKISWLMKQNLMQYLDKEHIIFVPGKKYKADYANPFRVLIDDTPINVKNFRDSGGHSILFLNVEDTLNKLQNILEKITY